jgi:hypothetical protein
VSLNKLWLIISFENVIEKWPPDLKGCKVILKDSETIQDCFLDFPYRCSPLFPLSEKQQVIEIKSAKISFYCFQSAAPLIGKVLKQGSKELINNLWYSIGLASVIVISENEEIHKELLQLAKPVEPLFEEVWKINNSYLEQIDITPKVDQVIKFEAKLVVYKSLPVPVKVVVDEFLSNIAIIVPKVIRHIPNEKETFVKLVNQVNELILELIYLSNPKETELPETLSEYDTNTLLNNPLLRETISHQNIDRLIQINSALSYVSTQALTGAIPIFERRSLLRRHSLLGIGTATLALTRLARSIEKGFAQHDIEKIIVEKMPDSKPLTGLDNLPGYNAENWKEYYSVNRWNSGNGARDWYPKLPYYSGRLGFRETEYTISAAIQSISCGASLEWSLLTITHEMLHGHVRNLLTLIFQSNPKFLPEERKEIFYNRFADHIRKKKIEDLNELDSIRTVIFTYCSLTLTCGSITKEPVDIKRVESQEFSDTGNGSLNFYLPKQDKLWRLFEQEYRNINEIFVQILDLHYFYGSRLTSYIPLIWRSWTEVPHVKGDLRQYILRSLLTISVKTTGEPYDRFYKCLDRLEELLENQVDEIPLINEIRNYIDKKNVELRESLFYPFFASLILVDLIDKIFVSFSIRGALLNDPLCRFEKQDESFEEKFSYEIPIEFSEDIVKRPAAYLLSQIEKLLYERQDQNNIEANTAKLFLLCSSYLDEEEKS